LPCLQSAAKSTMALWDWGFGYSGQDAVVDLRAEW